MSRDVAEECMDLSWIMNSSTGIDLQGRDLSQGCALTGLA